jgi:hypothetical protein
MNIDYILNKLEKVKTLKDNKWVACCPAHNDKSPSLAIAYKDGKILLHCFSGCSSSQIINALGIDFSDLFDEKIHTDNGNNARVQRGSGFTAIEALVALSYEARIIGLAAGDMAIGIQPSQDDLERIKLASLRIDAAIQFIDAVNARGR